MSDGKAPTMAKLCAGSHFRCVRDGLCRHRYLTKATCHRESVALVGSGRKVPAGVMMQAVYEFQCWSRAAL
jgi:hypothetical protein